MTLSRSSIALLVIQLALVSSIAAKCLYQRHTCPKVWTRAVAYDPEMLMRGRYLSARLYVDTCGLSQDQIRAAVANTPNVPGYLDMSDGSTFVQGKIEVRNEKLALTGTAKAFADKHYQPVVIWPHVECSKAQLWTPVDFYLSEKAKSPFPLSQGQELWVEVTVPPIGPPRPICHELVGGCAECTQ